MTTREGEVMLLLGLIGSTVIFALVAFSHGQISLLWFIVFFVALFAGFWVYERYVKHRY